MLWAGERWVRQLRFGRGDLRQSHCRWVAWTTLVVWPCFVFLGSCVQRWSKGLVKLNLCYDLVAFRGKPSQSFVCRLPYSWYLFKSLFRTLEDESKNAVDCSVQSSAKEFYYLTYSFILTIWVTIQIAKSHNRKMMSHRKAWVIGTVQVNMSHNMTHVRMANSL